MLTSLTPRRHLALMHEVLVEVQEVNHRHHVWDKTAVMSRFQGDIINRDRKRAVMGVHVATSPLIPAALTLSQRWKHNEETETHSRVSASFFWNSSSGSWLRRFLFRRLQRHKQTNKRDYIIQSGGNVSLNVCVCVCETLTASPAPSAHPTLRAQRY